MWKGKDGKWISPEDKEDTTFISHLLAEKVSNPKMTKEEWDCVLPDMRLCIKEAIEDISHYSKPSPKEILVQGRRSEKLKNILGE